MMVRMRERGTLHYWWECKLVQPLWKAVWRFLKNLKIQIPFVPGIPLLRIYPKNVGSQFQKNICTPMFIAALFTVAKTWKQPKCPSVDDWIRMWNIYHNGILFSHKKETNPTICNNMDVARGYYA